MLEIFWKIVILGNIVRHTYAIEHINSLCNAGYELSATNECEPVCDPECGDFANCVAPETCKCFVGYTLNTRTKECELECDGDIYTLDENINQCVLKHCSCPRNGYCLGHIDMCSCYQGYQKTIGDGNVTTCEPVCQPQCNKAKCTAPNECQCWPGYDATEIPNICEPNVQSLLALNECQCKVDYFPYAIGIVALVMSLILVILHIVEKRGRYFVKVIRQNTTTQPLVYDDCSLHERNSM